MRDVFIVSAVRTPIGRFGGAFRLLGPAQVAAPVMEAALEQANVSGAALDLIVFGNVLRGGHGQLVPRQAAQLAKIPSKVDAVALDMVCSSGMMSVITAGALIQSGAADVVLAGGTESMSQAQFALSSKARWGYRYLPGPIQQVTDLLYRDGLSDPASGVAMGVQAERLAKDRGIRRALLDEVAALSHVRAAEAVRNGCFDEETVPVPTSEQIVVQDEGIRPDTTVEGLGALEPVFEPGGVLTAGNSSQISDGAAALLLASDQAVQQHAMLPLARIRGSAWAAGTWWRFIEAPVEAARRALRISGLDLQDIDLFENNEAFALSTVLFEEQMGTDRETLNVHGGAIALGHPIGCSGARLIVTLLHALKRQEKVLGMAALCHGTGGGTAVVIEMQ